jgi:2'-5' RNA ligase
LLATTAGLAVFPSASPALYLPVVRSRALDALHRAMTDASVGVVHEPHPHYHPDAWVPHITVARLQATTASLDVPTRRRLARAVAALADRDHAHAVRLPTLACLHDDGTRRIVDLELTLGDRSA